MPDYSFINLSLLLWGCIICLIAALCLTYNKSFDPLRRKWMLFMQIAASILLLSDSFSYIFRGKTGTIAFYMVRVSNFLVFAVTDITVFFFHQYICVCLLRNRKLKRTRTVPVLCTIGVLLVIVSQFTGLYYGFDSNNLYHRNPGYIISMLLPFCAMLIDLSLLIQFRKNISSGRMLAMSSYIVLPLISASIQTFFYGYSLINISIAVSMLLMYIVAVTEQGREYATLAQSRQKIAEELEVTTVLNQCVAALSSDVSIDRAIQKLLQVINEYFHADRAYIFEIDYDKNIIINTYENVREMVSAQKENLQGIPLEVIRVWMDSFEKYKMYFIEDLEQEKDSAFYEILKDQDIRQLLAVPLMKDDTIIGFLGVDNPGKTFKEATLLYSIQFFITNGLERKKQQEYLEYLSYRDSLTSLYNRNKYNETIDSCADTSCSDVSIVYMDLNGLKKVNDQYGHEAGDHLICQAASILSEVFSDNCYRIGGDEFVVIMYPVAEDTFKGYVQKLYAQMDSSNVSGSVGFIWNRSTDKIENMLKEADKEMYQQKMLHYKTIKKKDS